MLRNGVGSMTLVGRGAATDSFVSLLLPQEYSTMMRPGERAAARAGYEPLEMHVEATPRCGVAVAARRVRACAAARVAAWRQPGACAVGARASAHVGFCAGRVPMSAPAAVPAAGEKLGDLLGKWRACKAAGQLVPFVLFPQVRASGAPPCHQTGVAGAARTACAACPAPLRTPCCTADAGAS